MKFLKNQLPYFWQKSRYASEGYKSFFLIFKNQPVRFFKIFLGDTIFGKNFNKGFF